MNNKRIVIHMPAEAYTGYGILCMEVVKHLVKQGYQPIIRPLGLVEDYSFKYPDEYKKYFNYAEQQDPYEIVFTWPYHTFNPNKKSIAFTMWESTKLRADAVANLNKCVHVIVPSEANKKWFVDSGVRVPITVVPLGVDPKIWNWRPNNINGKFIFGCAGRMKGFTERKHINKLFPYFSQAFPYEHDVELQVKCFPDDSLVHVFDTRIKLIQVCMQHQDMANLMATWNCGIFMSSAEGWGLCQNELQALGRPIIAAYFGGICMHSKKEDNFPVEYDLVEAPTTYNYFGNVAKIQAKSLVETFRYVYTHRKEVVEKGLRVAENAAQFTWENTTNELIKVLKKIRIWR